MEGVADMWGKSPTKKGAIFLLYKELMDLLLLERKRKTSVEGETKLQRKTKLTKIQKLDESNQIKQTGKFLTKTSTICWYSLVIRFQ